ncbi:hypothetical protein Hanom_Chr04g00288621 [Helianthus anomalus]
MMKLVGEVLKRYEIHISQINALGMPLITYFEFVCKPHDITSTWEMFNVLNLMTVNVGYYSFTVHVNVDPMGKDPPKTMHAYKQKFFYIRVGVISIEIIMRKPEDKIKKEKLIPYEHEAWYAMTLTSVPSHDDVEGETILKEVQEGEAPWLE